MPFTSDLSEKTCESSSIAAPLLSLRYVAPACTHTRVAEGKADESILSRICGIHSHSHDSDHHSFAKETLRMEFVDASHLVRPKRRFPCSEPLPDMRQENRAWLD